MRLQLTSLQDCIGKWTSECLSTCDKYKQTHVMLWNFNISAIDLKLKRGGTRGSLAHTTIMAVWRGAKKCENFRIVHGLHFYSSCFFILGRDARRSGASQRGSARFPDVYARTGHALPSAAGYYFSRRIFPQMNFMKTVFALLINRSSVAGPTVHHFSSRAASPRG